MISLQPPAILLGRHSTFTINPATDLNLSVFSASNQVTSINKLNSV